MPNAIERRVTELEGKFAQVLKILCDQNKDIQTINEEVQQLKAGTNPSVNNKVSA